MADINTGGAAFPQTNTSYWGGETSVDVTGGMTLRDYFAGQAIASGLIKDSYPEWQLKAWFGNRTGITREEIIAAAAYAIADALLKARSQSSGGGANDQ